GNDFLIIDGSHSQSDLAALSRAICDRHKGVGADGVEWLFPTTDADIEARLFNSDGSEAEISGNGTRCVAAYLCSEKPREIVKIRTGAGIKACVLTAQNHPRYEFEIAMGRPQEIGNRLTIRTSQGEISGIPVSMGNPHFVLSVDDFAANWQLLAAEIGRAPE